MTTHRLFLSPTKRSFAKHRKGVERPARREEAAAGRIDVPRSLEVSFGAAEPSGRSPSGFGRADDAARARRLLEQKLEYIYDRVFDKPDAEATLLAPMPAKDHGATAKHGRTAGLSPDVTSLDGSATLLRPEEEAHLFLKMNYLKYRASKLREALEPSRASASELAEIERLQGEGQAVKNQIVRANLRLVVSIARRWTGPHRNLFELVSEGNLALILAAEKFDVSRGFKFSTYASCAISRSLSRTTLRESSRRHRFVTGHHAAFEIAADHRSDEGECECDRPRSSEAVEGMLRRLDDRERRILVGRYGLGGGNGLTRLQLSDELGISKERVRQIELRAHEKLRKLALDQELDPTAA